MPPRLIVIGGGPVGIAAALEACDRNYEVTLFEAEVLDALQQEHGIAFAASEHRRNLTTRDVRLDDLVGQRFRIGDVVLEYVKDCPPCEHLEQVTGKPVLKPLLNRGGIRARVVIGGMLRVGDRITVEAALSVSAPAPVPPSRSAAV